MVREGEIEQRHDDSDVVADPGLGPYDVLEQRDRELEVPGDQLNS